MNAINPISKLYDDSYDQVLTRLEPEVQAMWCIMNASPRPCFTPELLSDLQRFQEFLQQHLHPAAVDSSSVVKYMVLASNTPGVFSLGGDLRLFADLIEKRDREALRAYAHHSIDVLYLNAVGYHRPVTTIALLQGDTIGAGFETALSCNVIIAERSAKIGFPEVLFNLFPGMGAYTFLARRIDPAQVERMIVNGTIYNAEELYEMGVVDVVADDGAGESALYDYIKKNDRFQNAHQALYRVRQRFNPVTYEELIDVADIWVDAALNLGEKNLRTMQRLVKAQDRKTVSATVAAG